ncbi:hypothetical protein D3C81_2004110 [compost metagenome]
MKPKTVNCVASVRTEIDTVGSPKKGTSKGWSVSVSDGFITHECWARAISAHIKAVDVALEVHYQPTCSDD